MRPLWLAGCCLFTAAAVPAFADHVDVNGEKLFPTFDILIQATFDPTTDYNPKIAETTLNEITFTNVDIVHHDIHGLDGQVEVGLLLQGDHKTVTVPLGTHVYACFEHPWMLGVLTIEEP